MSDQFDPYFKWLGIPPEEQPADHYRLLSLPPFTDDLDVIENAVDQRMSHLRTFQSGKNTQHAQRILNELSKARVSLLNPQSKTKYDTQLRAEIAAATNSIAPHSVPDLSQFEAGNNQTAVLPKGPFPSPRMRQAGRPSRGASSLPNWLIPAGIIGGVCLLLLSIATGLFLALNKADDEQPVGQLDQETVTPPVKSEELPHNDRQPVNDTSKLDTEEPIEIKDPQNPNGPVSPYAIRITPRTFVELEKSTGIVVRDQPFTIEFWLRCKADVLISVIGDQVVGGQHPDVKTGDKVGWMFSIFSKNGVGPIVAFQNGGLPFQDGENFQWFHIGITTDGGELKVYQNGKLKLWRKDVWKPSFTNIYVGDGPNCRRPVLEGSSTFFDLTDLRISSSRRYKSDFVPPTSFSTDSDTVVLLDFSKQSGKLIRDLSGNNHHGKITGAIWTETGEKTLPQK